MNNRAVQLTRGQKFVLAATCLPMAAVGVAGGVASYLNFASITGHVAGALSVVLAGEGATLVCALVLLSLTLMGQHSPAVARAGLWLLPMVGSAAGVALAPDFNTQVIMGVAPLAMTAAGEGVALVARRVVRHNTGVDLEAQRRAGLLVWHSGRAVNGGRLARRMSKAAVWRLTKQFAASDAQMAIQVDDVQRFRIGENLDGNLLATLVGAPAKVPATPALTAVRPSERLAVTSPAQAPLLNPDALTELPVAFTVDGGRYETAPEALTELPVAFTVAEGHYEPAIANGTDGYDFIREVLAEAETKVEQAPEAADLITVAEAAALAGCAVGTVRSWISRGKLPKAGMDLDGRTLVSRLDVSKL